MSQYLQETSRDLLPLHFLHLCALQSCMPIQIAIIVFGPTFTLAITSRTSAYACAYHTTALSRFARATTHSSHSVQLLANNVMNSYFIYMHVDYTEIFVFNDHPIYASVYHFVVTFFSVRRNLQSLLHWHCALVPD